MQLAVAVARAEHRPQRADKAAQTTRDDDDDDDDDDAPDAKADDWRRRPRAACTQTDAPPSLATATAAQTELSGEVVSAASGCTEPTVPR